MYYIIRRGNDEFEARPGRIGGSGWNTNPLYLTGSEYRKLNLRSSAPKIGSKVGRKMGVLRRWENSSLRMAGSSICRIRRTKKTLSTLARGVGGVTLATSSHSPSVLLDMLVIIILLPILLLLLLLLLLVIIIIMMIAISIAV